MSGRHKNSQELRKESIFIMKFAKLLIYLINYYMYNSLCSIVIIEKFYYCILTLLLYIEILLRLKKV